LSVGADIEAECGRCGTTWHVVIAMVERRIAQVECRQCGRRHRLRNAETASARPHRRTGATGAGGRRLVAARPLVTPDPSRPPRPYRASETYAPGDRVTHPSFGDGVVERVMGARKVQVFFTGGSRVLVHGREA
jgi:hypothetical protein